MMLRGLLLLLLALLLLPAAQAQICSNDAFCPTADFRVFDATTGQPLDVPGQAVTVLCAGSTIRLRDNSGQNFPRENIRYIFGCFSSTNNNLDTVTTRTVPNTPGQLIIQQNTPNNPSLPGCPTGTGQLFSRRFEVRARPQPDFTFAYCGTTRTQVQVTINQPQPNVRYEVQVGTGPRQPVALPAATYAAVPGATTITVFGNYTDARLCEGVTTKPYPAQNAPQAPVLQRLTVQGGTLQFAFAALQPDYRYMLEQDGGTGNFQRVADIPATATTFALPSGSLTSCYRLRLTDACNTLSLPSASLCPVNLTVTSLNGVNSLRWTQPAGSGVTAYDIIRNEQALTSVPAPASSYDDTRVTCGVSYRYQIVARSAGGASASEVRSVQTLAGQLPTPPELSASFNIDNAVELTVPGTPPADARLLVRRSLGTLTEDLPPGTQLPVLDRPGTVTPDAVPCYTARFADPCGNASPPGPAACPSVLSARPVDLDGNEIQLRWTAPVGQGFGWTYNLLLLDAQGQVISNRPLGGTTTSYLDITPPADRQVLRYRLSATSAAGRTVFSNVAPVVRRPLIAIPTAFTPNGDGRNDVLEIKGRFIQNFTFTILDRNGNLIFRTTSRAQTWDGRVNGVVPAPQVFTFRFEATDETGQRVSQNGTVTLLR